MPKQTGKKFIPLRNEPYFSLETQKQQAILAIKQTEKNINGLIEKLKFAQDFLATELNLSLRARQKLEMTVQKGLENVVLYQATVEKMKRRLIDALKTPNVS